MFDLINGLPVHPLVVHAVVVLLPLSVVGTFAIVLRPSWRHVYGPLVLACAAAGTALTPVATSSGEALEERVGDPGQHAEMGDQLLWFAVPLLLLVAALVLFERRPPSSSRVLTGTAVLALVAAVACGVQVYRVGDSGAKAAWEDRIASSNQR